MLSDLSRCNLVSMRQSFAVFISNEQKAVPLLRQRSSNRRDGLVIWDYHVVCITMNHSRMPVVLDLDTSLPFPCPAMHYVDKSCVPLAALRIRQQHRFRIVPAASFLDTFASDRSHMLTSGKRFPVWPTIRGRSASSAMNLPLFWDMIDGAPRLTGNSEDGLLGHTLTDLAGLKKFIQALSS